VRYILIIFFIFLFSLTVISCSKKDDSSSSSSAAGTYQLATNDYANGVATDSSGNVYVTGGTKGGLDGNTSAGNTDLFVVKYNSSGTKQWTKQLGSSSRDYDFELPPTHLLIGKILILKKNNILRGDIQYF